MEGVAETALFSIHVVIVEFLTKREQTSELYLFETWFFTDCVTLLLANFVKRQQKNKCGVVCGGFVKIRSVFFSRGSARCLSGG